MFTGLVEEMGTLAALSPLPKGSGQRLRITAKLLDDVMPLGASLAVDGVCLTVVAAQVGFVDVEAGPETMQRTTLSTLRVGQTVHLERALRLSDRLGGHVVSGHVDGVGTVTTSARRGDNWDVTVAVPTGLLRYVIEKGAIAIDGISLTVNSVDDAAGALSVSLVPHTQGCVTLANKPVGGRVNVEVDLIGKYVERLLGPHGTTTTTTTGRAVAGLPLTLEKLKENGFV